MVPMPPAAFPAAVPLRRRSRLRRAVRFQRRRFGRRRAFTVAGPAAQRTRMSDDLRLFASTFAAGFLFVSVLIG